MAFRYHADHVGSLLRPQELLDARRNPQVAREQLTAIEDRHILAVSPQCGFASTMEGNLLSEKDQWRKLQLVVDTARRVWTDA
jgi:methionine synthase II (cobalamin-independent)